MDDYVVEGRSWGECTFVCAFRPQTQIEIGDVPVEWFSAWAGGYVLEVTKPDGSTGWIAPCKVEKLDCNGLRRCSFKREEAPDAE